MRAFWAVLGILMLSAAVYLMLGRGQSSSPQSVDPEPRRADRSRPTAEPVPSPPAAAPARPTEASPEAPELAQSDGAEQDSRPIPAAPATSSTAAPSTIAPPAAEVEPSTPSDEPELSQEARDAQLILRQLQSERSDSDWIRASRLWMAEIHAEVERTWNSPLAAHEVARNAVRRDSHWRTTYLDATRDRITLSLREQGLAGEELGARTTALVRGVEEVIEHAVLPGVISRREIGVADGKQTPQLAAQAEPSDLNETPPTEPPAEALPDPAALAEPEEENAEPKPQPGTAIPATAAEPNPGAATPDGGGSPAGEGEWLVHREDGSMVADGRYTIRGKGTAEDPYKISWDHLVSAEEEYVPRDGRTQIPRRIQMLHDKHVEITGYIAFPLLLDSADELLVMLNQWDGCCLGVPPTPYDAVEVLLKDFVTGNARMASYGTVSGRLKVEPHLVGGWLVGLYLMEDATLKPLAFGGFAP